MSKKNDTFRNKKRDKNLPLNSRSLFNKKGNNGRHTIMRIFQNECVSD